MSFTQTIKQFWTNHPIVIQIFYVLLILVALKFGCLFTGWIF